MALRTMKATNTIFILSDEHNRDFLGCVGNSFVKTPHLDRLAVEGARFANAYTNSPVCVSARASLATGRYPHQIKAWDSTMPYDGSVKGWASRLVTQGHEVTSIGKLHYRNTFDPNGFSEEIIPMHVHNGTGWLSSLLRDPPVKIEGANDMAETIGAGETRYTVYDRTITDMACDWIDSAAGQRHDKPWVLYVGLVAPHFPLVAPQEFFDLYSDIEIPPPRQYESDERPQHPVIDAMRFWSNYDDYFDPEKVQIARWAYCGLCSFLDHNIGKILGAVEASGLTDNTRIIYTSDHGDNLGNRGLWGKSVMYDDAVAVPLIINGPEIPRGVTLQTPVSLVDIHPTLTEFAGEVTHPDDSDLPGTGLSRYLSVTDTEREVFSEYHDWSSITGMFMLRRGNWKLVVYPGHPCQLFDLEQDPDECCDLGSDPAYASVIEDLKNNLKKICDYEEINQRAFKDQKAKIELLGGRDAILNNPEQAYTPPPGLNIADQYEP